MDKRSRRSKLPVHEDGPCVGHPCDDCPRCVRGICCRRDNPAYHLPELGSLPPLAGSLGVLRTDGDQVECHLCGGWFRRLGQHLFWKHDVMVAEYKALFGLGRVTPLASAASIEISRQQSIERRSGASAEVMRAIRPTAEQTSASSSRPERLSVRTARLPQRRVLAKAMSASPHPHAHNEEICRICGRSFRVPPSAVVRGRKTCGRQDCLRRWRLNHSRPPSNAKLTAALAIQIRERLSRGGSQRIVATEFGVTQSLVSQIHREIVWRSRRTGAPAD